VVCNEGELSTALRVQHPDRILTEVNIAVIMTSRRHMAEMVGHMGTVTAALIKRKKGASAEAVLNAIAEVEDAR